MEAQHDQITVNAKDVHPQIFDQSHIFYMTKIFSRIFFFYSKNSQCSNTVKRSVMERCQQKKR